VHIDVALLAMPMRWLAVVLMALALAVAVLHAPWSRLRRVPERIHLLAGGALCCLLLWLLKVRPDDGVLLHFFGVATLTLLVGWSLALIAGAVMLGLFVGLMELPRSGLPVAWILTVLVPASVTYGLLVLSYRPRLGNPFVYMLGVGFLGSALGVLASVVVAALLLLSGGVAAGELAIEYWPLLFLMMFSEGFLNGMCVSALAVFRPDWLLSYDEGFFLDDASS